MSDQQNENPNPVAKALGNVRTLAADWTARQIDLIKRQCARDCTEDEFAVFLHRAKHLRLDPLRNQIMAMVTNKNDPNKRQLVVVVRIDGQRTIAARTNRYRPSDVAPLLEYDESLKGPLNPLGLVRAEVKVFQRDADDNLWHAVVAEAYWDEYAPIEDEWVYDPEARQRRPTGSKKLRATWEKMPRLMLAKCAEALALRKAWPDDIGSVYDEAEVERISIIDEQADAAEAARLAKIGYDAKQAATSLMFIFDPAEPMRMIERGAILGEIETWLKSAAHPGQIAEFKRMNQHNLNVFWAWEPADALAAKQLLEARHAELLAKNSEYDARD